MFLRSELYLTAQDFPCPSAIHGGREFQRVAGFAAVERGWTWGGTHLSHIISSVSARPMYVWSGRADPRVTTDTRAVTALVMLKTQQLMQEK